MEETPTRDVFLTHEWASQYEINGKMVGNHERVSKINKALQLKGLITWFDEEQMEGIIDDKMCEGIDESDVFCVFVTARYIEKVAGKEQKDNCKKEFQYASRRRGGQRMVPVVMEEQCRNTNDWKGAVAMTLGGHLYTDFSSPSVWSDQALFDQKIDELYEAIVKTKTFGQISATPASPPAASTATPAALDATRPSSSADVEMSSVSASGMQIGRSRYCSGKRMADNHFPEHATAASLHDGQIRDLMAACGYHQTDLVVWQEKFQEFADTPSKELNAAKLCSPGAFGQLLRALGTRLATSKYEEQYFRAFDFDGSGQVPFAP